MAAEDDGLEKREGVWEEEKDARPTPTLTPRLSAAAVVATLEARVAEDVLVGVCVLFVKFIFISKLYKIK